MVFAALVVIAGLPVSSAVVDDGARMKALEKGAMKEVGYYVPQRVTVGEKRPATLKKLPEGVTEGAGRYGVLPVAGPEGAVFHVVLVEAAGAPAKLYVDSKGNGDMADDAAAEWEGKPRPGRDGKEYTQYSGSSVVQIGTKENPFGATLGMYRFDPTDPQRESLKDTILYYRDYATTGEVTIGGRTFRAMLSDEMASGDFRGKELNGGGAKETSGVNVLLDVNGNGKFDRRGESFDVRKPFNIKGTTYELAGLTRDGLSFGVVKSSKTVEEVPTPPDHEVGKIATSFTGTTMDGKAVKFPSDYKGKVVMLDFWATWCGPCMGEVPGLSAAYEKFHAQGFEILGVTLDKENATDKIKQVTADNKMTWAQIYDGKYWQAAIAQKYAIDGIPAAYLVDGETGEIIAAGDSLRGEKLAGTIESALRKRGKN